MNRRSIVKLALAAGLFSVSAGSAYSQAQKELKFATFVPPNYVLHEPVFQKFANDVEAATGGSVKIKMYPSGELGQGPAEQYQRAVRGIAEISFGLQGYTSTLFPKNLVMELPGIATDGAQATSKLWANMDKHFRDEYKRTVPLAVGFTAPTVIMSRDKPIRTPDDLKGLKIRVPSKVIAAAVEAYGATPVLMPANNVYTAMSTGVVDGAFMGADSLLIFKMSEVSAHVTTNLPLMVNLIFVVMNEDSWNGLSDAERAAIQPLTGEVFGQQITGGLGAFGEKALKIFAETQGKSIIELTADEKAKFEELSAKAYDQVVSDLEKQGIDARAILSDLKD